MPRLPEAPARIQPRDLEIFRSLFESRIMGQAHVAALHFGGRGEAAKKRLQILKAGGYIQMRRRMGAPAVLSLSRRGIEILRERGILQEYPALGMEALARRSAVSERTEAHELAVLDVKAAFHRAVSHAPGFELADFMTWPAMYRFEAWPLGFERRIQAMKPDGFIQIEEAAADGGAFEHSFFLETDRSTESHETLVRKTACYMEYFRSGGFALWRGGSRDEFKEYPFRVLFVVESEERRNTLAHLLASHRAPILTMACVGTAEDVLGDPLGEVWITPRDFAMAVQGSAHEKPRPDRYGKARHRERDAYARGRISKIKLLA